MAMQTVKSTFIKKIGYNPITQDLSVVFHSSDKIHVYPKISEVIYQVFMTAESKGRFFHQFIDPDRKPIMKINPDTWTGFHLDVV